MEARVLALVLVLTAVGGCLGGNGPAGAPQAAANETVIDPVRVPQPPSSETNTSPSDRPQAWLERTNLSWETTSQTEPEQDGERFQAPAGTGGIWLRFSYRLEPPAGTLELFAESPEGERIDVLFAQSGADARDGSGTFVLPGIPGEWWIGAESDRPSNGSVQIEMRPSAWSADLPRIRGTGSDRPVVAIVDTGINPYHGGFQTGLATADLPPRVVEQDGDGPVPVELEPRSTYQSTLRADIGLWESFPPDTLVHFQGTNLLAYGAGSNWTDADVLDGFGHGTGVSHAVQKANPNALILFVSADGGFVDALRWTAKQPWIDVVSLSWGPLAQVPGVGTATGTFPGQAEAMRDVWDAGKLIFAATSNDPTLAVARPAGAPWVHAVSGAHEASRSRVLDSQNVPDTVANWTQTLALAETLNETARQHGTSFATPRTAGVASAILGQLRQAVGHQGNATPEAMVEAGNLTVANSDFRAVLNRTAVYWNTTDYGGPGPGTSLPMAPTPWASMGWGYLDARRIQPAVDHLLGENGLEPKSPQAQAFMQANLEARKAYWNR